jgi:hypothetical protein
MFNILVLYKLSDVLGSWDHYGNMPSMWNLRWSEVRSENIIDFVLLDSMVESLLQIVWAVLSIVYSAGVRIHVYTLKNREHGTLLNRFFKISGALLSKKGSHSSG